VRCVVVCVRLNWVCDIVWGVLHLKFHF
jgi:hypothetical protein